MLKLLDLFCGAGGSAVGYARLGFEVVGVDIVPQPHYPFEFHLADALDFPLEGFDVIHASPPCQAYSVANNIHGRDDHPKLIEPVRALLKAWGGIYVIENVPSAPLIGAAKVCGLALGLGVKRHRFFESNRLLYGTKCPKGHPGDWVSVFGHTVLSRGHVTGKNPGGGNRIKRTHLGAERGRQAMGIDWMNRDELSEAIPPAYSEFIGRQLLEHLHGR